MDFAQSLQKTRQMTYNETFFVAKLLEKTEQVFSQVDGQYEAQMRMMLPARKKKRAAPAVYLPAVSQDESEGDVAAGSMLVEDEGDNVKNSLQLKQRLLHPLSTGVAINTRLHGEFAAFRAVFKDWEVALPHETICTVLEFLGVSSTWLGLFTRYLQAPLRFAGESQPPRVRRRGVPFSHVLSDVFSETVLFCLDMAVNQITSGQPLWRIENDLWFWSADHQATIDAWTTVEHFASVTATSINEKSGSVRISHDGDINSRANDILPQGEIRWGFLILSPQTGRFEIDQAMVDLHITELLQQLNNKKHSVFAFIQTWNTYAATFFSSNFGRSANCFGRQHVDDMLATHRRIQRQIFSEDGTDRGGGGSARPPALSTISRRPSSNGLGSRTSRTVISTSPSTWAVSTSSRRSSRSSRSGTLYLSPNSLFETMLEAEREAYKEHTTAFYSGAIRNLRRKVDDHDWQPESLHDRENFLSFDEFVRYREYWYLRPKVGERKDIGWVYTQLMEKPKEQGVDQDIFSESCTSLSKLDPASTAIKNQWAHLSPYWRWVTVMYGPEIVERFGDLNIVDAGLLPMGMVGLFRDKRVTWKD